MESFAPRQVPYKDGLSDQLFAIDHEKQDDKDEMMVLRLLLVVLLVLPVVFVGFAGDCVGFGCLLVCCGVYVDFE